MSEKKERPYFKVIENGKERREYIDKEGLEKSFGETIAAIFKEIFK